MPSLPAGMSDAAKEAFLETVLEAGEAVQQNLQTRRAYGIIPSALERRGDDRKYILRLSPVLCRNWHPPGPDDFSASSSGRSHLSGSGRGPPGSRNTSLNPSPSSSGRLARTKVLVLCKVEGQGGGMEMFASGATSARTLSPQLSRLPEFQIPEGDSEPATPKSHRTLGHVSLAADRARALEMLRRSPIFTFLFSQTGHLLMATPKAYKHYSTRLQLRGPDLTLPSIFGLGLFSGRTKYRTPEMVWGALTKALFEDKAVSFRFQQQQVSRKQKKRWVEFECWPAEDPVTAQRAILVSQTNLTQQKELELGLLATQHELRENNTKLQMELHQERQHRNTPASKSVGAAPIDVTLELLDKLLNGKRTSHQEILDLKRSLMTTSDLRAAAIFKDKITAQYAPEVGLSLMEMLQGSPTPTSRASAPSAATDETAAQDRSTSLSKLTDSGTFVWETQEEAVKVDYDTGDEGPQRTPSGTPVGGASSKGSTSGPPAPARKKKKGWLSKVKKAFKVQGEVAKASGGGRSVKTANPLPKEVSVVSEELLKILNSSISWEFNVFELEEASAGHPLSCLRYYLFEKLDLIAHFRLDERKLMAFFMEIEAGYPHNPYHNRVHAADVLQSTYLLVTQGLMPGFSGKLELLAALVAAVIHDFEHSGVNNNFLVRTGDERALTYNDKSPQENHHVSASFKVLRHPHCAFTGNMAPEDVKAMRTLVISMVLATDMASHFHINGLFQGKLLEKFKDHLAPLPTRATWAEGTASTAGSSSSTGSPAAASKLAGAPSKVPPTVKEGEVEGFAVESKDMEDRSIALQMAVKIADLGHIMAEPNVHLKWVYALEEENFRQGDQEKAIFGEASPLMDRQGKGISSGQCGFFDIVVFPLFEKFVSLFEGATPALKGLQRNYQLWKLIEEKNFSVEQAMIEVTGRPPVARI